MAICRGCGKYSGIMIPEYDCEECIKNGKRPPKPPDTYTTIKGVLVPNPDYEAWCKKYKTLRYKW